MKHLLIASSALIALTGFASAAQIDGLNITASTALPTNTFAPFTLTQTDTLLGVQGDQFDGNQNIIAKSPFNNSSQAYDAVLGGGSATFSGSFGTGGNSLTLVWGTPDSYNTLLIVGASQTYKITGGDLASILQPNGSGSYTITLSGMGSYNSLEFSSSQNSFEFAAVSNVPLPASAPMFGAALVALGAVGYGVKRKGKAASAA